MENERENDEPVFHISFQEQIIRRQFIAKVYGFIFLFITATLLQVFLIIGNEKCANFLLSNQYILYLAIILYALGWLGVICFPIIRVKKPYNIFYIILMIEALTIIAIYCDIHFASHTVIYGFFLSWIMCILLSVSTFICDTTISKFVIFINIFVAFLLPSLTGCLLAYLLYRSEIFGVIAATLATAFFAFHFYYETLAILTGRYLNIEGNQYFYAALVIYTDFMIFALLMMCFMQQA